MTSPIRTGAVHHLRLTVTDVDRACQFYTQVMGFQVVMELPPTLVMSNGSMLLAIGPALDEAKRSANDRFDENRVGLDHLSFAVTSRDDLVQAVTWLDAHGIPHGELKDLGPALGIYVLVIRDPDNIQLELTAPYNK